jgi:dTMP kinase
MPFITFEGIEGSGKSTQARGLAESLGSQAVLTSEPGATAFGREIRSLLLDPKMKGAILPDAELLLFLADRLQHVGEIIRPSLDKGLVVICDRFADSTIAYQGYGRGLPVDKIRALSRALLGDLRPDLTFLLDISVDSGLARVGKRGTHDRFEMEQRAFHERVRDGFRALAIEDPQRWVSIDAEQDHESIAESVSAAVRTRGWLQDVAR